MSNVAGLRECWSDVAFGKHIEFENMGETSSESYIHTCQPTKEQRSVNIIQNETGNDVEETIYLDERDEKGKDFRVKFEQLSLNDGAFELESTVNSSLSYFDIIPDELTIKILSFVPLKELYQTVVLLSKRLKDFALSPILWQNLHVDETRCLTSESLKNIICKNCPLLKHLDIRHRDDLLDSEILAIAKACPLLQQLTISFCGDINKTVTIFAKYSPSLTHINMEGCNITDECLSRLTNLPLKSLNMSHCVHLTDEGLIVITTKCNHLKSINIDGVQWITDEAVLVMVQNCSEYLEKIWLDGDNITDKSIEAISTCEKLKIFSISFCDSLSDNALTWIQQMKNLYSLRLKKGVDFSAAGLQDLFMNLHVSLMKNSSGLLYLSLPECSALNDVVTQVLAESCPNLITLNLSWCWDITDTGLRQVILNCKNMESLIICGLTDIHGECLIDLPQQMPHLKYLDASQCSTVPDNVLWDLVQTVSNMTIIDYYSEVLQPEASKNGMDMAQRMKFI